MLVKREILNLRGAMWCGSHFNLWTSKLFMLHLVCVETNKANSSFSINPANQSLHYMHEFTISSSLHSIFAHFHCTSKTCCNFSQCCNVPQFATLQNSTCYHVTMLHRFHCYVPEHFYQKRDNTNPRRMNQMPSPTQGLSIRSCRKYRRWVSLLTSFSALCLSPHCFPAGGRVNGWGGGRLPLHAHTRHLATLNRGRRRRREDRLLPAGGIQGHYTACSLSQTHGHTQREAWAPIDGERAFWY